MNDPRNGRLTQFAANGEFVKQHLVPIRGYGYRWNAWLDKNTDELVDPFIHQRPGATSQMEWRRWTTTGAIRDTAPSPSCTASWNPKLTITAETKGKGSSYSPYPFTTGGGSAPDGVGGVWCASALAMSVALVRVRGMSDTLARTTPAIPRIAVSKAERAAAIAEIVKMTASYATNDFDASKIPSTKSPIAGLAVDDDGRLWVQHASVFGDTTVTFDIHDRTGKHLGRLRIAQRPSKEGLPIRARGNDLLLALRDADDVIGLARYRIAR